MKREETPYYYMSLATEVALMVAVPIVGAVFLGNWIDGKLGTKGFFVILFTIAGSVLTLYNLYRFAMRKDREEQEWERRHRRR